MCPDLSLPQPSNWQGPKHSHTGFESVTSTNSAKAALKASAEMQPSADIFQCPGPLAEQPIAATNSSQYNSSADVGLRTARRNSNKMFQLIVIYVFTVSSNNSTRAKHSGIWSTSHRQKPCQMPSLPIMTSS